MAVSDVPVSAAADVRPALGPGDDDPRSPVRTQAEPATGGPLGPGDDDPKSPAKGTQGEIRGPLGAGESDGKNADEDFHFLTPSPAGPGGMDVGPRHMVRIPKKGR